MTSGQLLHHEQELIGIEEMSNCCNVSVNNEPTNKFFSRWSKRYAKRFRKGGLEKTQKYILEGVRKEPVMAKKILDIGCGVGSLHLTLLKEGAATATGVEVSEGMISQAKKFAEDFALQDRTSYVLGDFVRVAPSLQEADVTILDKVVCCYEDYDALISASTAKTSSIYALSHPRQTILMEFVFKLQISVDKLIRATFHPFWHDWTAIHRLILTKNFELIYSNSTIAWQVLVYRRIR